MEIEDFISPTIVEWLEMDTPLFKAKITDWRAMVDCVMIDLDYDGEVFDIDLSDVPGRKNDLVEGRYEEELAVGLRPDQVEPFREWIRRSVEQTEAICRKHRIRPQDLPTPSYRAYRFLKELNRDDLPGREGSTPQAARTIRIRAYQWLKFLSDPVALTAHLETLQALQNACRAIRPDERQSHTPVYHLPASRGPRPTKSREHRKQHRPLCPSLVVQRLRAVALGPPPNTKGRTAQTCRRWPRLTDQAIGDKVRAV